MILQGTIVNTLAVLLGVALGATLGKRLPERITRTLFVGIGLFTLFLGLKLSLEIKEPLLALLSILIGGILGSAIELDQRLRNLVERYTNVSSKTDGESQSTNEVASPSSNPSDQTGEKENPGAEDLNSEAHRTELRKDHRGQISTPVESRHPMHGVINAFLLFCVGSMTVLGCLQEGMGKGSDLLLAKSTLDGISSIALASAFGAIIGLVAIPLFIFQSSLTLAAVYVAPFLDDATLANLNGVGGLLLLGLALEILELRNIKVLNLLPALVLAPVLTNLQALATTLS